jgi:hypothetical protein
MNLLPKNILRFSDRALRFTVVLMLIIAGSVFSHAAEIGLSHDHILDDGAEIEVVSEQHAHITAEQIDSLETMHCGADITSFGLIDASIHAVQRIREVSYIAGHFWQLWLPNDTPPPRILLV